MQRLYKTANDGDHAAMNPPGQETMGHGNSLRSTPRLAVIHESQGGDGGHLRHGEGVVATGQGGIDGGLDEPVPVVVLDHGLLGVHEGLHGVDKDGLRYSPAFVPFLHTTFLVMDALTNMWDVCGVGKNTEAHLHPRQAFENPWAEERHHVPVDEHKDPVQERGGDKVYLERAYAGPMRDRYHHLGKHVDKHDGLGEEGSPRPILQSTPADAIPAPRGINRGEARKKKGEGGSLLAADVGELG